LARRAASSSLSPCSSPLTVVRLLQRRLVSIPAGPGIEVT
jgi:hypothetical protein